MIQIGACITSKDDLLKKVQVEYLYHSIRNPKTELSLKIKQLRMARDIDPKRYAVLKKQLPYAVCGIFNPPYRKKDNFAYIEYFILDIDHISSKELSLQNIKTDVCNDPQVLMCFTSPSEDGLKVMFKLTERCYDYELFSIFYKLFSASFSQQHSLEQIIDSQTSDVSRACFFSEDADAYYNPGAEHIHFESYVDVNNTSELFATKKQLSKEEQTVSHEDGTNEPEKDVINHIKSILNPLSKLRADKLAVYVPKHLEDILADLKLYIEDNGVVVTDMISISYGKKLRFRTGLKEAEVNLFYGKKGFSVVKSPRTGTSEDLNNVMVDLVNNFLFEKMS